MAEIAPPDLADAQAWSAVDLERKTGWKFTWPEGWNTEFRSLVDWASKRKDPIEDLGAESVLTPRFDKLSYHVKQELLQGSGVAWIRGINGLDHKSLNLLFLNFSLALGVTVNTYGRLYRVQNTGRSYRDESIPVSQTKAATGPHTDSSQKLIQPRIIGLCCITPAALGGRTKIVSAAKVHENIRKVAPDKLKILYKSYIRDLVTPGSDGSTKSLLSNKFPIFSYIEEKLSIRYMRYWIERGHEKVGRLLTENDLLAFDLLDNELNSNKNSICFSMKSGDMLFLDNTRVLHDREKFTDKPGQKRLYTRVWIE
ncbi:TauD/TfdA family dioxygenase [Microbulbifer sp. ANSA001]|uniref:TauD/TfdA family dioxygenase n=1 Tax=Microbulbifer sp. ANSA001 TaxID=3243358 RepID=UPI00404208B7